MTIYDVVYLALSVVLFVALAGRNDRDRFFVLLIAMVMVPRELNARVGLASISLTDAAFLAFVAPWLSRLRFERVRRLANRPEGKLLIAAFGALVLVAAANVMFRQPLSARMFVRDLVVYGSFLFLFTAILDTGIVWERRHAVAMFGGLFLFGLITIAIDVVPSLRDGYIRAHMDIHTLGAGLGFFDPTGGRGPYTDLGQVRIVDFIGGAPPAVFLLALCALWLSAPAASSASDAVTAILLSFLFYCSMYVYSRAYALALVVTMLLCVALYHDRRRVAAGTLVCSLALLSLTPVGVGLLRRFAMMFLPTPQDPSAFASHNVRWVMIQQGFQYFLDSPLLGIGLGANVPFSFGSGTAMADGVDSLFLTAFLKLGAVGGSIVVALFAYALVRAVRHAGARVDGGGSFASDTSRAFLPWLVGFLVLGVFAYPIGNISVAMFTAASLAMFLNGIGPSAARG